MPSGVMGGSVGPFRRGSPMPTHRTGVGRRPAGLLGIRT